MDKVLQAREERIFNIKQITSDNLIIALKSNIPGENKQVKEAYILTRLFKKIINQQFSIVNEHFYNSYDGPYYLFEINYNDSVKLKSALVEMEDNHPLGRFIDLDLYNQNKENISRNKLSLPARKCMLCDEDAFVCIRANSHSKDEIIAFISKTIKTLLKEKLTYYLDKSLNYELNLHPKFGLVTPYSTGSHDDMDYELMKRAQMAIIPGLVEMFFVGLKANDLDQAFQKCRRIGINAEFMMMSKTNNVNAYRGTIFVMGLVMLSLGYLLQRNLKYHDLYSNIIVVSKNLINELNQEPESDGLKIYHQYKIGGARREAYLGLPNVRRAVEILKKYDSFTDEALTMTLIEIIKTCEDTVMIKRSGSLEKYHYYRNKVAEIKKYNPKLINKITNEFIENKISCGGSADILIASIFIKLIFTELID